MKRIMVFTRMFGWFLHRRDGGGAAEAFQRGVSAYEKDDLDTSIADFTEAIRLDPEFAEAYCGRGISYRNKGEYDKAIADYTEAIRLDPKLADAYCSRGIAYEQKGEIDSAIGDYMEAIRLNPKNAITHNNLAWLLATCSEDRLRDGQRAIDNATQACELMEWEIWNSLDTLAAAYAETGKFDKAVELQQKAVELATKDAENYHVRKRLKLYKDGKPYRMAAKKN